MHALVNKIKKTLTGHQMVQSGDCVLVGVSGGPDSVALLRSLFELKQELNIELVMAHLNHGARAAESDRDEQFVRDLGEELNIKTLIEKIDVPAEQLASKTSFQETARQVRMEFFERAREQIAAHKIALGHTSDDQVETVLMNLMRGSGLEGLGGMNPVRLPFIRPLFFCSRSEIIAFLEDRKIRWCQDSSNEKTDYLRNRVRLELLPLLRENYNPKIMENLFEASGILRADNDWLNARVEHEFDRVVSCAGRSDILEMKLTPFKPLALSLQRRLVRKANQGVKGNLRGITASHVQDVLQLIHKAQKGKRIDLPDNIEVWCLGDHVNFKKIHEAAPGISNGEDRTSDWEGHLVIPGETPVGCDGIVLKTEIIDPVEPKISRHYPNQAFLDFDKTGGEIRVRFFQPGDRLKPLGMTGTKKVKSLFIDEKVPREIRPRVPILLTGENDIIWVYGTRIAEPFRVTQNTRKVLFIKGLPLD